MAKRTTKRKNEVNMANKNNVPPCGCAIGDLSAIAEQMKKGAEAAKEVNKTEENNIPPCGCAIGDLSAIKEKTKKED
jgi:hypothetical protein